MSLTDTLDDLISDRRIEPQLAMKILANFDRSITEALAEKVKARLTFKVLPLIAGEGKVIRPRLIRLQGTSRYLPFLR